MMLPTSQHLGKSQLCMLVKIAAAANSPSDLFFYHHQYRPKEDKQTIITSLIGEWTEDANEADWDNNRLAWPQYLNSLAEF